MGLVVAYFLHFTWRGLFTYFSPDHLMNLYFYWSRPASKLLRSNVLFMTDYYRPMGGVFYLGIYSLFGFNPLPFRIGAVVLLLANMFLLYAVARRLSESREIALLAVLIGAFHARMIDLYFDTGMVYDILCYFFYFSALLFYLRIRQQGRLPGLLETGVFVALYVAAMNSKEMAVSLPMMILTYEAIWHLPKSALRPRASLKWLLREGRTSLLSALLTAGFIIGKAAGPESLASHHMYKPHISWVKYFDNAAHYLSILFFRPEFWSWKQTAAILLSMLVLAAALRSRHALFGSLLVLFGFLPIAFVALRGGFAFYLPCAGLAIYLATLLVYFRRALGWLAGRVAALLRIRLSLARKPWLAGFGPALLFLAAGWYLFRVNDRHMSYILPAALTQNARIQSAVAQIGSLLPSLPPSSRVLFLDDPIPEDMWDLEFIVPLYYNDHTVQVERMKKMSTPLTEEQKAEYSIVIDYREGKYRLVKGPGSTG